MALQLPVVLHLESCRDCPEKDRREQLERNLGQVEQFLGAAFGRQIMLVTDQEQPEPEAQGVEMDRRGFLTSIRTEMKRTVAYGVTSVLPMSREGNGSLVYRSYLAGAVRKKREEARNGSGEIPLYRVLLPDYNRNCFACGICEKICPQHAIAVSGEQNGKRTIHISPERCTGCGLCARLCPWNGMNGLAWTAVPHLDRQPLVSVASESCRQCQKVIRPGTEGGLCPSCTLKYRRKRK
jgi:formate hydrogenlyase subunit 6/NADH:ubiquinone oxidoreductase subunit I